MRPTRGLVDASRAHERWGSRAGWAWKRRPVPGSLSPAQLLRAPPVPQTSHALHTPGSTLPWCVNAPL